MMITRQRQLASQVSTTVKELGEKVWTTGHCVSTTASDSEWIIHPLHKCSWKFVLLVYFVDGVSVSGKYVTLRLTSSVHEVSMIDEIRVADPYGTAAIIVEEEAQELERGWRSLQGQKCWAIIHATYHLCSTQVRSHSRLSLTHGRRCDAHGTPQALRSVYSRSLMVASNEEYHRFCDSEQAGRDLVSIRTSYPSIRMIQVTEFQDHSSRETVHPTTLGCERTLTTHTADTGKKGPPLFPHESSQLSSFQLFKHQTFDILHSCYKSQGLRSLNALFNRVVSKMGYTAVFLEEYFDVCMDMYKEVFGVSAYLHSAIVDDVRFWMEKTYGMNMEGDASDEQRITEIIRQLIIEEGEKKKQEEEEERIRIIRGGGEVEEGWRRAREEMITTRSRRIHTYEFTRH
ncbi:hypothetical protein ADUPG1_013912 [Aduncisulcus paluster]|uniref:Uncharacterized protein n=1 Tax=Aduncisulcus paluster TaxID=2918883 RepID=A0ABQ5K8C9_9EUKA|nr:hypothetical protein ADUPG1_013912 [Aduncisulcus paluster]